jgi:hypothetical protein
MPTRDSLAIFGPWAVAAEQIHLLESMASSKDITVKAAQDKVDELADKDVDTVNSDIRYMAYAARLRTAIRASTRYIAYVSSYPTFIR